MRILPSQSSAHEGKPRVDFIAHDREIELVTLSDARPIMHARAAERIHAHAHFRTANHVHVDDTGEVGDIGVEIVVLVRSRAHARAGASGMRFTPARPFSITRLASVLDPPVIIRIGRPAVRRVVLEPAAVRRIV